MWMTGPYSTVSAASGQGGLECVGVIKMAGDESSGGLSLTLGSKAGLPWDCQPEPLVACVWGGTSHSMGVSEREYLRGNVRRARDQGASCRCNSTWKGILHHFCCPLLVDAVTNPPRFDGGDSFKTFTLLIALDN